MTGSGTADFDIIFSTGFVTVDATPALTATLTPGTDASPTLNYAFIKASAPTVVTVDTAWPTGEEFHPIGTYLVPTAATAQTYGIYKAHNWTDHIWKDNTKNGHIAHLNEWIRKQAATWVSGSALTPTLTAASPDTLTFATSAGVVNQLHEHAMPAFDSSTVGTTSATTFFVVNNNAGAYTPGKDLYNFKLDSAGNATTNNDRISWVVWGVVSENTADCKIMVNLPSGFYNSDASAIADSARYSNYNIPAVYKGTGFLIAKLTYKYNTSGGGDLTLVEQVDLRGQFPSIFAGGTAGATTEFTDNTFQINDDGDATKVLKFQVSGVTTATTRTMTIPDADGTIALNPMTTGGDLIYGGASGVETRLANGSAGQVLQSNGTTLAPSWAAVAGTGDVTAAAVLGDNLLIRGDGAGKGVQNSGITVDDLDNITAVTTLTVDGDTSAGDLATIGYTAAEGLILTGQGSTYDVTIKNDADTNLFEIPTGSAYVIFPAGTVGIGLEAPQTMLHTQEDNGDTKMQVEIEQLGTGDAGLEFSIVGDSYAMGIDNDTDALTIAYSATAGTAVLGTSNLLTIAPSTGNAVFTGTIQSTPLTASEIIITDASKNLVSAAVATYPSLTELTYVKGVTSAIQTQLTAKMTNPMTTGGDVIYGGASGVPTRLANGTAGQVLQSNGTTTAPSWEDATGGSVSFGTDNQIPHMNAGGTDFDYNADFTYDGTSLNMQDADSTGGITLEPYTTSGHNYALFRATETNHETYLAIRPNGTTASASVMGVWNQDSLTNGGRVLFGYRGAYGLMILQNLGTPTTPLSKFAIEMDSAGGVSGEEFAVGVNGLFSSGSPTILFKVTQGATNLAYLAGHTGIGIDGAQTNLHVQESNTDTTPTMEIEQLSTGDAGLQFSIAGDAYAMGIDNSDSDNFKISYAAGAGTAVLGTGDRFIMDSSGNINIGGTALTSKLYVDQASTTAAIPVLTLDQADISEEMIEFVTTIGTGNAIEAVGAKTLTTTHFIKVTLPGGLTRYIPAGTIA